MHNIGDIKNKYPVLERKDRKTILLLSDDIRFHSGVGTVARELVYETAHRFNWIHVGGAGNHPNRGEISKFDTMFTNTTGIPDAALTIYAVNGYGTPDLIRSILNEHKIDVIIHFTDPRFWVWLYDMNAELKTKIPIGYLSLWDDTPVPYFNYPYYRSSDLIMSINRQSHQFNKNILKDESIDIYNELKYEYDKVLLDYIPHGINGTVYKPIDIDLPDVIKLKNDIFKGKEYDFIVMFNNRNIRRKMIGDILVSFNMFINKLNIDKDRCALYMHTAIVDEAGTDLQAVVEDLFPNLNIYIDERKYTQKELNILYNICDVTINIANAEGFGLSSAESIMAGTMVINNVTGGLQDHMRFEDKGNWIELKDNFMSNNTGLYKQCGEWAIPVFPSTISLTGTISVPYLNEDRTDPIDVAEALYKIYMLPKQERKRRGLTGRNWLLSDESRMNSPFMCSQFTRDVEFLINNWKPRKAFTLFNALEQDNRSEFNGLNQ